MKKYLYLIGFASAILLIISLASLAFADSLIIPPIVENNPNSYIKTTYEKSIGKIASYRSKSPDLPDIDIYIVKVSTDLETYVASDTLSDNPSQFLSKKGDYPTYRYKTIKNTDGSPSAVENIVFNLSNSYIEKICIYTPS